MALPGSRQVVGGPQIFGADRRTGKAHTCGLYAPLPSAPCSLPASPQPYVFFDVSKGQEQRREGGGSLSNRVRQRGAARSCEAPGW